MFLDYLRHKKVSKLEILSSSDFGTRVMNWFNNLHLIAANHTFKIPANSKLQDQTVLKLK